MYQIELDRKYNVFGTIISGLESRANTVITTEIFLKLAGALKIKISDIFFC